MRRVNDAFVRGNCVAGEAAPVDRVTGCALSGHVDLGARPGTYQRLQGREEPRADDVLEGPEGESNIQALSMPAVSSRTAAERKSWLDGGCVRCPGSARRRRFGSWTAARSGRAGAAPARTGLAACRGAQPLVDEPAHGPPWCRDAVAALLGAERGLADTTESNGLLHLVHGLFTGLDWNR